MGDPKMPRKIYTTPGHPWQSERIAQENKLLEEYGLKNKREVWKHYTQLRNFRQRARQIAAMGNSEQAQLLQVELFAKLKRIGALAKANITLDDVLTLEINNLLERRLQTIVFRKGMAHTPKQARQFITHGHVSLNGHRVTAPSYIVDKEEESNISFRGQSLLAKPHPAVPKVTTALDEMKRDIAIAKGEKPEAEAAMAPEAEAAKPESQTAKAPKPKGPKPEGSKQDTPKQDEAKPDAPETPEKTAGPQAAEPAQEASKNG